MSTPKEDWYGELDPLLGDDELASLARALAPKFYAFVNHSGIELSDGEAVGWEEADQWTRYLWACSIRRLLQWERDIQTTRSPTTT